MYMAFMENAYSVRYKQERLTYELLTLEVCIYRKNMFYFYFNKCNL